MSAVIGRTGTEGSWVPAGGDIASRPVGEFCGEYRCAGGRAG